MHRHLLLLILNMALSLLSAPQVQADLLVIVHKSNPLVSLSENEVRKIFLGRMRLFPRTSKEILSVDQEASMASQRFFYKTLMNMDTAQLSSYRASYLFSGKGRIPETVDSDLNMLRVISENPAAIGYVDQLTVEESALLAEVKVVFRLPMEREPAL
jgi:ABC-type phosphate transport system substrate-binding protein